VHSFVLRFLVRSRFVVCAKLKYGIMLIMLQEARENFISFPEEEHVPMLGVLMHLYVFDMDEWWLHTATMGYQDAPDAADLYGLASKYELPDLADSAVVMFTDTVGDMVNMLQGYDSGDADYCQLIATHIYRRVDLEDSPILHNFIKVLRSRWSQLTENQGQQQVWRRIFREYPQLAVSLLITDGIEVEWWTKADS